jgi:hypothetical protein
MKVVVARFPISAPLLPVKIEAQIAMIDTIALSSSHHCTLSCWKTVLDTLILVEEAKEGIQKEMQAIMSKAYTLPLQNLSD